MNNFFLQDSYGYNLVAQLVGAKRWILFPPNQSQVKTAFLEFKCCKIEII